MEDVFELFCQCAELKIQTYLVVPVCEERPKRKHKKRRIQKKWLKRYGTRLVLLSFYRKPIDSWLEIRPLESLYEIEVHFEAMTKPRRTLYQEQSPLWLYEKIPPSAPSAFQTIIYEFPRVGQIRKFSFEGYQMFCTNKLFRQTLISEFITTTKEFVEEGTKVRFP